MLCEHFCLYEITVAICFIVFLKQAQSNLTDDFLKSKVECKNPLPATGGTKILFQKTLYKNLTVNDSLKCVFEAKNPLHKLWPCAHKCSGNVCIM